MSSSLTERQLNKEEMYFVVNYFKETKNWDEMIAMFVKLIQVKQVTTYNEFSILEENLMYMLSEKKDELNKLKILE